MKCFRLNDFLMRRVKYRIIVRSCIDVMPVFKEVILIYAIGILVYSVIGMFLYSGILNTTFIEKYHEVTGEDIDEGYFLFNMNDLFNSFIFFLNISMNGAYLDLVH